jgi:hypothetical protein
MSSGAGRFLGLETEDRSLSALSIVNESLASP